MKSIVLSIAALFVSTQVLAATITANSAWSTILASRHHMADTLYPVFGPQGIFNACATATELKSVAPVTVCAETKYVPGHGELSPETVCLRSEKRHVSMARSGVAAVCVKHAPINEVSSGECLEFQDRPYTLSLSYNVQVLHDGYGDAGPQVAFVKAYTIPTCK